MHKACPLKDLAPGDALRLDTSPPIAVFHTEDGELRRADLTGVFYAEGEEMTYTVTFSDYGTDKDITAP